MTVSLEVNGITCGPLVRLDLRGIPLRASTRKDSPYYYPASEAETWVILLDGKRFSAAGAPAGIIEFDRTDGWLLMKELRGEMRGLIHTVRGTVEVLAGTAIVQ